MPIVAGQPSPSDHGPSRFVPGGPVHPASGPSLSPPAPASPVPVQPAAAGRSRLPEPAFSMQVGPWPHWQELLSAPTPDAERIWGSLSSPELAPPYRVGRGRDASGLWSDTDTSRSEDAEGRGAAAEWPRADLAARSSNRPSPDRVPRATVVTSAACDDLGVHRRVPGRRRRRGSAVPRSPRTPQARETARPARRAPGSGRLPRERATAAPVIPS